MKIDEEVPTTNISSGAVADPQNKPLGKKVLTRKKMSFKNWLVKNV